MIIEIKHRFSGEVHFAAEVDDKHSTKAQLGAAVVLAYGAEAHLRGAYLSRAGVSGTACVDGEADERGNRFAATLDEGDSVVCYAGCRAWRGIEAARAHYAAGVEITSNKAAALARLNGMHTMATALG